MEEPTGWVNCLVIAQKRWQPKTVPRSQGSHAEQFEISAFEQIVGLGGKNLTKGFILADKTGSKKLKLDYIQNSIQKV